MVSSRSDIRFRTRYFVELANFNADFDSVARAETFAGLQGGFGSNQNRNRRIANRPQNRNRRDQNRSSKMDHRRDRLSDRRHPRRSRLARPGLGEVNSALPAAVSGCHKTAQARYLPRPVMFRKTREATMSCAARPLALSRSSPRPRHLVLQERNQCGRAARRGIALRASSRG
jgi:hypothetical protein